MIDSALKNKATSTEKCLLLELKVAERLKRVFGRPNGLSEFAKAFYFIRYSFSKLNFLIGAKCPPHEKYWSGLVENLLEELGGRNSNTHNQLYRDFLREAANQTEDTLSEPGFARQFNQQWEEYCLTASFRHGLLAIGLYEALDNPDYQLLYSCVKDTGLSKDGLRFFAVHASAAHYEIFENIIDDIDAEANGSVIAQEALDFVIRMQRFMWGSLLTWLENRAESELTSLSYPPLSVKSARIPGHKSGVLCLGK